MATVSEQFWSRVALPQDLGDCFLWSPKRGKGAGRYATFTPCGGRSIGAHRYSYMETYGAIPDGMTIDHLCMTPKCVNPMHLEVVSRGENTLRGNSPHAQNKRKTHCPRGHEYSAENTYIHNNKRECRECGRIKSREWQRRNRKA